MDLDRLPKHDPILRRRHLFASTSWRLFWVAFVLSALALALLLRQSVDLYNIRTLVVIGLFPTLNAILALDYWRQTFAARISMGERLVLLVLRLGLWIGLIWHLLCLAYFSLDWASGRGLLVWFTG